MCPFWRWWWGLIFAYMYLCLMALSCALRSSHGGKLYVMYIVKVKATRFCSTPCNPMDSTVRGIPQARILERVAFSFSKGSSQPRDRTQISGIAGGFFTS